MCNANKFVSKAFGAIGKMDPIQHAIYKNNKDNKVVNFLMPAEATSKRAGQGDSLIESLGDPTNLFTKTKEQKDAIAAEEAYAAAAPERALLAATTAANQRLILLRRRRASSALATGGTSGTGLLSSVLAYGKSSLGG